MSLRLFWASALIFRCAIVDAQSINIVLGHPENGGFGDIASNVLMSQQLQKTMPDAKLRVIVYHEEQLPLLKILLPTFDRNKSRQELNGIEYVSLYPRGKAPKADFVLSFSAYPGLPKSVVSSAPIALLFNEPVGNEIRTKTYGHERQDPTKIVKPLGREARSKTDRLLIFTGPGDTQAGLYLEPTPAKPTGDRSALLNQLDEIPMKGAGDLEGDYGPAKIIPSYTSGDDYQNAYLRALSEFAGQSENRNQKFLVITQAEKFPRDFRPPANVEVRAYSRLPFGTSNELRAHSDSNIPQPATGSVSLSKVLDYNKLPFYEMLQWKVGMARTLKEDLGRLNPNLGGYESEMTDLFMTMPKIQADDFGYAHVPTQEKFLRILNNPAFLKEVRAAIAQLRRRESLSASIPRFLETLQQENIDRTDAEALHQAFLQAKDCGPSLHLLSD